MNNRPRSPHPPARRRPTIPASLATAVCIVAVIALPVVAGMVDDSADEFTLSRSSVGPAIGWLVCAGLLAVAVTRRIQILFSVEEGSITALLYDALPLVLLLAWVVLAASALTAHWLLAVVAGALCLYHLILVIPRLMTAEVPRWVGHAPRIDVVVANVFIDNETPQAAAAQLVETAADVAIIVEATPSFIEVFDAAGGTVAYPFRVVDPDDDSDYAVTIASRRELGPRSLMTRVGPLRVAIAEVDVDGTGALIVAVNPMATLDDGGHVTWKQQIEVLKEFVPTLSGPLMLAGDLNTTRFRPEFEELLALGLIDAIDALGKGLAPSFKLRAEGALGNVGAVVRLDHALVNEHMYPVSFHNLEARGSDHLPFVIQVAVRTGTTERTGSRWARRRRHVTPRDDHRRGVGAEAALTDVREVAERPNSG